MNAGRWNLTQFELRRNPLEDPVVIAWDTLTHGGPVAPSGIDAADVALIATFLTLDRIPEPSSDFVDQLGQQLAGISARERSSASQPPATPRPAYPRELLPRRIPSFRGERSARWPGWLSSPAVAALLVALLIGGLFVGHLTRTSQPDEPPAIPAVTDQAPGGESGAGSATSPTTFSAVLDPAGYGVPDLSDWNMMVTTLLVFAPGDSLDTSDPWYTAADGLSLVQVQSGSLQVVPGGAARLYRSGSTAPPMTLAAGTPVTVDTGDTVVYSTLDEAMLIDVTDLPVIAIHGYVGYESVGESGGRAADPPYPNVNDNVSGNFAALAGSMPTLPSSNAGISFERVGLAAHQQYVQPIDSNQRLIGFAVDAGTQVNEDPRFDLTKGALDGSPADPSNTALVRMVDTSLLHTSAITLTNPNPEPIIVYLFSVEYLE